MKLSFSLFLFLLVANVGLAQDKKALPSPRAYVKNENIEISYGQPSKKGRVIFGGLVPYGEVWRTGANEATEITFKKNCKLGGKMVKAGTYTLFTIPQEKEWTIILNTKLKQWGAYEYQKNKENDVLNTTAPVKLLPNVVEKLTISATKDALMFEWDKTSVSVPMAF